MTARAGRDELLPGIPPWVNGHKAPAATHSTAVHPLAGASAPAAGKGRRGRRSRHAKGGGLLAMASGLLLLLAAAQGYVSFRAQYLFIDHAKQSQLPSMLEALGLDTGAVIFALLALSLARRGRSGNVERVLNVACAFGSLTMNLLAADLNSPRSITVWVMPSALYALASDRLIAVVRRSVLASDPDAQAQAEGSAWQALGGLALWALRLILDVPGTAAGFRRWVLAAAPVAPGIRAPVLPAHGSNDPTGKKEEQDAKRLRGVPGTPHEPLARAGLPAPSTPGLPAVAAGETKRHALIRLYQHCGRSGDPRCGDPAKTAELASEIAARIGYHPGTARRELAKYLASHRAAVMDPETDNRPGGEGAA